MAIWLENAESKKSSDVMAEVLYLGRTGERVKFLVRAGDGHPMVQRMRVALSRSRKKNLRKGNQIEEFTLHHTVHPYTEGGKRFDCVVMWKEKRRHHVIRELLADTLKG